MKKLKKKETDRRSDCPLSCTLDLVGDKWSLLIIRDMMFAGKSTYNELLASDEHIATNILNDRLIKLTNLGVITFSGTDKRKVYSLTPMGFDLKPVLAAVGIFGMKHFEGSLEYMQRQHKDDGILEDLLGGVKNSTTKKRRVVKKG